ncbi:hypothetical protein P3X46_009918 [Hevea brasiliensis]|uniref:Disease resistance R13L4/SHOC-2-like LRR domain-containing protein n=1 Tax=Hevea brasiliensis TaxID=3981 RepID=A0ABQ9MGL0_HEVBR|nr:hypothetical protein P3X46_009918 [Hevea brasiliensis]
MRYLRLLQINAVHLTGAYRNLFDDLRWFCWPECTLKSIPPNLRLDNLVVLEMQFSNIRKFSKEVKVLKKLQILDLSHSVHLAKISNFSGLPSLERLILGRCTSLVNVHQSIGHLKRLVFLNLEGSILRSFHNIFNLKSLEILNISGCSKLGRLPDHLGNMEALAELVAEKTDIKQLPSSIGHLKKLAKLSLGGLEDGMQSISSLLPASFAGLTSLTRLVIANCGLTEDAVCIDLGCLSSLVDLDLRGNNFFNLPAGIGRLPMLKTLWLHDCRNLRSISEIPSSLKQLLAANCTSLERVSLQSKELLGLSLLNCPKLVDIQGLEGLESNPIIHVGGTEGYQFWEENSSRSLWQVLSLSLSLSLFHTHTHR